MPPLLPATSRLGQRLRELRGFTSLYDIERTAQITRTLLSRYERGKHIPSPNALRKLAKVYGVTYEELRILELEDLYVGTEDEPILLAWAQRQLKGARA